MEISIDNTFLIFKMDCKKKNKMDDWNYPYLLIFTNVSLAFWKVMESNLLNIGLISHNESTLLFIIKIHNNCGDFKYEKGKINGSLLSHLPEITTVDTLNIFLT